MIPGETSRVTLTRASHERYGYSGLRRREESPGWTALSAALSAAGPDAGLEFVVELEGFDAPVNWHAAELDDALAEAEANRREGNQLSPRGNWRWRSPSTRRPTTISTVCAGWARRNTTASSG